MRTSKRIFKMYLKIPTRNISFGTVSSIFVYLCECTFQQPIKQSTCSSDVIFKRSFELWQRSIFNRFHVTDLTVTNMTSDFRRLSDIYRNIYRKLEVAIHMNLSKK